MSMRHALITLVSPAKAGVPSSHPHFCRVVESVERRGWSETMVSRFAGMTIGEVSR